jgi:serine/threonine-protein kinase
VTGVERELNEFASEYLARAATTRYADVCATQERPWPTIATGAGGVAYVLWRTAGTDPARLDAAHALLEELRPVGAVDYLVPGRGLADRPMGSAFYDLAGTSILGALVAHARGDSTRYEEELARVESAASNVHGLEELLLGAAGLLVAVRTLHRHTQDPRCGAIADVVARRLLARPDAWGRARGPAFGHGTAGILHSLLAWAEERRRSVPQSVSRWLTSLATAATASGAPWAALDLVMQGSFCAGAAGLVLLWTKAYEVTGEETYLRLAEKTGLEILTNPCHSHANLCCGSAGRAYALLALDRVQPDRGWDERAAQFALSAVRTFRARRGSWPHGLFKGAPGIVCLALDVTANRETRGGFPLVES